MCQEKGRAPEQPFIGFHFEIIVRLRLKMMETATFSTECQSALSPSLNRHMIQRS